MSVRTDTSSRVKRRGIGDFVKGGTPIVGLTAYTAPIARLLDPHVDFMLVGDSLAMVVYGFDSTLPVTLEMMIAHGAATTSTTTPGSSPSGHQCPQSSMGSSSSSSS